MKPANDQKKNTDKTKRDSSIPNQNDKSRSGYNEKQPGSEPGKKKI